MSKFQRILDSFSVRNTLNPKVWENFEDPKKATMIPKVRKALMRIAEEFIDYLGEDVFVDDVVLTGSLANFNWSEFSDFDLHIIVDLQQNEEQAPLYKELYNLKKQVFNDKHNIKIYGYDVELYAQDNEEPHFATGVYSVMNDEWVTKPEKLKNEIDKSVLEKKIKNWTEKIDKAIETETDEDNIKLIDSIKEKIKDYRKSGLEKEGELSYENLTFKFLRRSGHIQKLFDKKTELEDKELSVERIVKEDVENINAKDAVSNSSFLTELMKLVDQNFTSELTPGMKPEKDKNLEKIQTALQLTGFLLPDFGINGKFGKETQDAIKKFQEKYQLNPTGKIDPIDLKHLIAALIVRKFKDSDLSNIRKGIAKGISLGLQRYNATSDFRDVVEIITDNLEGGYYHPRMKEENPSAFGIMGDSGETLFGLDRKHGRQEELSSAGREFWDIIDSNNASQNWRYGYDLSDNPKLKNKLLDLASQIMQPQFENNSNRYLSDEAQQIVNSDPKLFLNFAYATYNGMGWFRNFAEKFNSKVASGETNIENLRDYALKIRKEAPNQLIRRSGDKIEKIFDTIV